MPKDFRIRIAVDNKKAKRETDEFSRSVDRLTRETRELSGGMKGAELAAKKTGTRFDKTATKTKKLDNVFGGMTGTLIKTAAVVYALKKALDFSITLKNVSRDAVETLQKFEQVFSSMTEAAHNTSQSLQNEFKLAGATAQELLGNTGDLLVGFGFTEEKALSLSRRITALSLDLRSFKNIQMDATEVTQLMISAMSGNMRAIRRLGVVLRLEDTDLKKLIKTYEIKLGYDKKQAVALAVLDEAYNQSFKSVGDFTRTQHQLANQERILSEAFKSLGIEFGDKLLPVFGSVTTAAIFMAETLSKELIPIIEDIDVDKLTEDLKELSGNMVEFSVAAYENRKIIMALGLGFIGLNTAAAVAIKVKALIPVFSALAIKGASLAETLRLIGMYAAGTAIPALAGILSAVTALSAGSVWAVLDAQRAKLEEDLKIGDTIMKLEMLNNVFGQIPKTLKGYDAIADPFIKLRNSLQAEYDEVVASNKKITEYNESAAAKSRGFRKLELDSREQEIKKNLEEIETLYKNHFENIGAEDYYKGYAEYLKELYPELDNVSEAVKRQVLQYSDLSKVIDDLISSQQQMGTDFLMEMGIDIDTVKLEEAQEILANIKSETIMVQYVAMGLSPEELEEVKKNLQAVEIALAIKIEGLEESSKEQEQLLKGFHSRALKTTKTEYAKRISEVEDYYTKNRQDLIDATNDETAINAQQAAEILKIKTEQTEAINKIEEQAREDWLNFYNNNILDEIGLTKSGINAKLELAREYVALGKLSDIEYIDFQKQLADDLLDYKVQKWEEEHELYMGVLDSMFAGYDTFLNNIFDKEMTGRERSEAIWDSMRYSFVGVLGDMVKEYIKKSIVMGLVDSAAKAVQVSTSIATGAAITTAMTPAAITNTLATGGASAVSGAAAFTAAFASMMGSIPKFSTGTDFIVPPGYNNDSYPMFVESGERVKITPRSQVNNNTYPTISNNTYPTISNNISQNNSMFAGYDTFLNNIFDKEMTGQEKREAIWESMRSSFVSVLGDMAKEYIKKMAVMALADTASKVASGVRTEALAAIIIKAMTPAAAVNTLATGGMSAATAAASFATAFSSMLSIIPKFSTGADFIVPPGHNNDSYPMFVESGERVKITPRSQVNNNTYPTISNNTYPTISNNISQNNSSKTEELLTLLIKTLEDKPVANTMLLDNIDMSRYVEGGDLQRSSI